MNGEERDNQLRGSDGERQAPGDGNEEMSKGERRGGTSGGQTRAGAAGKDTSGGHPRDGAAVGPAAAPSIVKAGRWVHRRRERAKKKPQQRRQSRQRRTSGPSSHGAVDGAVVVLPGKGASPSLLDTRWALPKQGRGKCWMRCAGPAANNSVLRAPRLIRGRGLCKPRDTETGKVQFRCVVNFFDAPSHP